MTDFFLAYRPLIDLFLLHIGFAFSQWIVLKAGVFSVATAGFAALGAYTAALVGVSLGLPPALGILAACLVGLAASLVLSWPLARLRGVYQAIATLAFVQIVVSLVLYAEPLTGGALGFTGIPKVVTTPVLLMAALLAIWLMVAIDRSRVGRAFEAIRQDEAMAASLGISVRLHHVIAFAISGALAGLFAGLEAFHSYALEPNQFGFPFLVAILSYVVLGGRRTVVGPIVGAAILIALPELSRPLAENRMVIYGVLLVLVMNFLPRGVADTFIDRMRRLRAARLKTGREGPPPASRERPAPAARPASEPAAP